MIDVIKTKEKFGIEIKDLLPHNAVKIVWQCDVCKTEKIKRYDEAVRGNGLCIVCSSKKTGQMLGEKYSKTQKKQGKCKGCGTEIASQIKWCQQCIDLKHEAFSKRMSGANNPAWTGKRVCQCGKKKSSGAEKCRNCSFISGARSAENNGRFVKENREEFLANKTAARVARTCLSNILNSLGIKKDSRTEIMLGYTFSEFKVDIEAKFEPWMNWSNKGLKLGCWNIDHIIPVDYFVSNGIKDPSIINALWNLRPIEYKANIQKSNKITEEASMLIATKLGASDGL